MAVVINCTDEKGVVVCEHQQHFSGHSIRSVALAAVGQHFFFWIVSNGSSSPPSLFLPVSLLSLEDERHSHSAKWISPTCPYFNRISFIHFFWMGRYASVRHWVFFFFFFLSFHLSLLSLAFFIASCRKEKRKEKLKANSSFQLKLSRMGVKSMYKSFRLSASCLFHATSTLLA